MKVDYKKRYEEAIAKLNDDADVIGKISGENVKLNKQLQDAQAYITELGKQRDSAVKNFETAKMIADTNAKACVERGNSLELAKVIETGLRKALEQQANVIDGLRYDIVTISEAWQDDIATVQDDHARLTQDRDSARNAYLWMRFTTVLAILTLAVVALVSKGGV